MKNRDRHNLILRVAARAAALEKPDSKAMAEEVLSTRVDNKQVAEYLKEFLQNLIKEGKEVNRVVEKGRKTVEDDYYKAKMTNQDLEAAILEWMKGSPWGNEDAMAKLLAKLLAHGDFVW